MNYKEIIQRAGQLPASEIAESVDQALTENPAVVITAPPGAGKSTLLPLTMMAGYAEPQDAGKILMLEPRRIAARQIAERMAHTLGEKVGKTVGYRVRFDTRVSDETRIEVVTEGILTRMLVSDATLEGVGVVIFDEFHERSINSDLALTLARQCQSLLRPDLKIVVMSATIDTTQLCQSLHAPLIESKGKMYPVEIAYTDEPMAACIARAHREHEGDILAFLPGQGEIEKCANQLGDSLLPTVVYPLYGNLSPEQQRKAIAPSREGERKVVLATPIAETSLTIEGVRIVVDSGLYKKLVFNQRTGLSHLETCPISLDMATQRMGRAGRVAPGHCYRLWAKSVEHLMPEQRTPEIEDADLASLVLDIVSFGESDIASLPWLTPPPAAHIRQAKELLQALGALDDNGNLTAMGKKMQQMACHPRISRMILSADSQEMQSLACDIAAILEEKCPCEDSDVDIAWRINLLRDQRRKYQTGRWTRIAQVAAEYRKMAHASDDNQPVDPKDIGWLTAHAYPERIAKALDNIGNYRLASGNNVSIDASDAMTAHTWIAIASLYDNAAAATSPGRGGRVLMAAPLDVDRLDDMTRLRTHISWESKQGMVVKQQEKMIGKLVVDSKPIQDCDRQQVIDIVCEAVKKDGLSMFDWNDHVKNLQLRVAQVAQWHPELGIPDLSTAHLIDTAQEWLPFYLEKSDHILQSTAELKKIDLKEVIWALIPYDLQAEIDRLAPTHIQVPTGSRIRVEYRLGAEAPVLSVRLQECFGMEKTPCVNDGKQPLLMELLSPGFKTVQLTQDLESFWHGTYFEVRKELKRRYPKHYWPENPLEAEAVRGVKRK